MPISNAKAADIVREKLLASGGSAIISLQQGGLCTVSLTDYGRAITSDKLNGFNMGCLFLM